MYSLTPIVHKQVQRFIDQKNTVNDLVAMLGSPLNIMFPQATTGNVAGFETVFTVAKIDGRVYYAHKANKSVAIVRELSKTTAHIDVASTNELRSALANGFAISRIQATGPKNDEFLTLCIIHGIIIAIDDPSELTRIIKLNNSLTSTSRVNVMIRLNDFTSASRHMIRKDVRFGISSAELPGMLITIKNTDSLHFVGYSFHLPTTSVAERAVALESTCAEVIKALEMGLRPEMISIGGGFSLNFLESENEWKTYINALKESVLHPEQQTMSWNGSGLGFWSEKGTLKGSPKYFEFFNKTDQFEELAQCLAYRSETLGSSLAEFCSENGIVVAIEPGRSLLDQAGVTVARVQSIRKSLLGEDIIVLDMNRSNINAQDLEYMADPIHIPVAAHSSTESYNGFIMGSLCLPHDLISRRRVYFKATPQAGDLLVFANTAGYFMDFSESNVLQHNVAKKIAICSNEARQQVYDDEQYPLTNESNE